ncbi:MULTISPECIES: hypothetical protein [unclassified Moorena]|nr:MULTISPECIES: hypothetical protein [unclassified Moorena]NEP68431.1 hypothetical protein [Moorena sp. SIO3A5]NER91060.1 hypothetical protein [Moorena sp. SIO3A2]NES45551.1 hypothetical protein [Moorena sp. SIO2C4]
MDTEAINGVAEGKHMRYLRCCLRCRQPSAVSRQPSAVSRGLLAHAARTALCHRL